MTGTTNLRIGLVVCLLLLPAASPAAGATYYVGPGYGIQHTSEASVVLVPVPAAVLLGLLGFGAGGLGLWCRRTDLL